MDYREATSADAAGIRRVAEASLRETYVDALGEHVVSEAADEWYRDERFANRVDDEAVQFLIVEDEDGVVAFSESELDGDAAAAIEWLHVHPDHREQGIGVELLERTETGLLERGANRIEGRVIAANQPGNDFYQDHGYVQTGVRTLDVGDATPTEHLYVKLPEGDNSVLTERRETAAGTLYVAFDERERGSSAPFYSAYGTPSRTEKYGFFCANCESVDTSMDSMGRVECADCGNERKPTRWDSAYL